MLHELLILVRVLSSCSDTSNLWQLIRKIVQFDPDLLQVIHDATCLQVAFYICADGQTAEAPGLPSNFEPAIFGYHLVAQYPHDTGAFTEGLIYERGCSVDEPCQPVFWESTGSSVPRNPFEEDVHYALRLLCETTLGKSTQQLHLRQTLLSTCLSAFTRAQAAYAVSQVPSAYPVLWLQHVNFWQSYRVLRMDSIHQCMFIRQAS